MRQIFSSPRLENVEAVAELLQSHGIEVRVTDRRSYKGNRRSSFSYSDEKTPRPAVWVVNSEDQIRARDLLREAGLIDSTRPDEDGNAAPFRFESSFEPAARTPAQRRANRIKLTLIFCIVIVLGAAIVRGLSRDDASVALQSHPLDGSATPIPDALARAVFAHELAEADIHLQCLQVDGHDASQGVINALFEKGRRLVPVSECRLIADEDTGSVHKSGLPALIVEIHGFRPKTRDSGTLEYSAYHHRMSAKYKTLEVKLTAEGWKVVRALKVVSS